MKGKFIVYLSIYLLNNTLCGEVDFILSYAIAIPHQSRNKSLNAGKHLLA